MKKAVVGSISFLLIITVLDYFNVPTRLGFEVSNINWDFYMDLLNVFAVLAIFIITFEKLNRIEIKIHKKEIEHENNKYNISLLLLQECYKECLNYIDCLTNDYIEKFIVPKIDFNSPSPNLEIINDIQSAPFKIENCFMDFAKDGQITQDQIKGYLEVKRQFGQYIMNCIIAFDDPDIYEPLKSKLYALLNVEMDKVKKLIMQQNL